MAKLNQTVACIIPLPKSKDTSDSCFCLTAKCHFEITWYINVFFRHLLQSVFNADLQTLHFNLCYINYWGVHFDNWDFEGTGTKSDNHNATINCQEGSVSFFAYV